MPEQISVEEFLHEAWDDYKSPTTSNFVLKMGSCRNTVTALEETLDSDRSGLTKMKKSVKALYSTGSTHVNNEIYFAENLDRLGNNALNRDHETELGMAFQKFAVVTKELSALMKNLMQNLNNILMFPLDSFLKGDLRGVKGDMKKPFDKAWKEYESKFQKIEKERKRVAMEAGMIKTEVTGPEVAEEMEKERRLFQLQMCEYLVKVNEIKTKKGVNLLQHLVEYYHAQMNYFQDGMKTIEHFKFYIEDLVKELNKIKHNQEQERQELIQLRDELKNTLSAYKETGSIQSGYSLHQLQGKKEHGCQKRGVLLKKSEGKIKKVWQKRKCEIRDGFLSISHSDSTKEPTRLNLLTCQVKLVPDDAGKKCFDLVSSSKNRTYHFQGEDQRDMEEWISVLNNAKEAVFNNIVQDSGDSGGGPVNASVRELSKSIIKQVRNIPGNKYCCDCGAQDPEWLSQNLGVLICLECCGVHREMGVHISRTQSVVIDDLGTAQLLLARSVSNKGFNEVMEAMLDPEDKPTPKSSMDDRKKFIRSKYEKKRFAIVTNTNTEDRRLDLIQAVHTQDLYGLIQVFAEGIDFMEPLPDIENHETALHLAVRKQGDDSSLCIVDFIVQNSNSQDLCQADLDGDTALHLCARLNKTECIKLILRVQPDLVNYENIKGKTPLEVAIECDNQHCVEVINHAIDGKTEVLNNINIDWELFSDDHFFDDMEYSDDDLDRCATPDRTTRSRPGSIVMGIDNLPQRERAHTVEALKYSTLPLPQTSNGNNKNKVNSRDLEKVLNNTTNLQQHNVYATLTRQKKAPAPLPPSNHKGGHTRNPSDPGTLIVPPRGHTRTPSDPPPIPSKTGSHKPGYSDAHRRTGSFDPRLVIGGKLVLPPPPEYLDNKDKPNPPPRPTVLPKKPTHYKVPMRESHHRPGSKAALEGRLSDNDIKQVKTKPPDEGGSIDIPYSPAQSRHMIDRLAKSFDALDMDNELEYNIKRMGMSFEGLDQSPDGNNFNNSSDRLDHRSSERLDSLSSRSTDRLDSASSIGSIGSLGSQETTPIPNPREKRKFRKRKVRALYDCDADQDDELSFREGDIIVVLREDEEEQWWEGYRMDSPAIKGMFPCTFVEEIE